MKITLEPRKTTWVPFVDSAAKLEREWQCRAEYTTANVLHTHTRTVRTRYTFTGVSCDHPLPSSQLIIMEQGIPLTITQTVVSALRSRFQSEEVEDPFLVITDKLAGLDKHEKTEKRLAKGLIERTWSETLERNLHIENKTGREVTLELTIVDDPASELRFVSSDPAPNREQAPEYNYSLTIPDDEDSNLKVTLRWNRTESIRTPVARTAPATRRVPNDSLAQVEEQCEPQMMQFAEAIEEIEEIED